MPGSGLHWRFFQLSAGIGAASHFYYASTRRQSPALSAAAAAGGDGDGHAGTAGAVHVPPARRFAVPTTAELNRAGFPAAPGRLRAGSYRAIIDDADVRRCVERGAPSGFHATPAREVQRAAAKPDVNRVCMPPHALAGGPGLERAFETHALVYWPNASTLDNTYGVVLVPGTGGGTGPAYSHRAPANKFPGPVDASSFMPETTTLYTALAQQHLQANGVPAVQVTWCDFRSEPQGSAERAYGYDGQAAANPKTAEKEGGGGGGAVDALNDVASAKVEAAVKLLLQNGVESVVLIGHSMGAAICCEAARRLLAADRSEAGTGAGDGSAGGSGGTGWRRPEQLRALCLLSGAGVHWTLGKWGTGTDGSLRLPRHRALVAPNSLLEAHGVPLLIFNAEHDIGCAKGVYWEEPPLPIPAPTAEGGERQGPAEVGGSAGAEGGGAAVAGETAAAAVKTQGMFQNTWRTYALLADHQHSWFRGKDGKRDRLDPPPPAAPADGREHFDVAPTIAAAAPYIARWVAANDRWPPPGARADEDPLPPRGAATVPVPVPGSRVGATEVVRVAEPRSRL
eukprot:SAG22_NODE_1310_length_4782_cov_2.364723_3_plen_568_part_00